MRYDLPPVDLWRAELSSETVTVELAWTAYRGPKFEAYEIHRQAGRLAERIVKKLTDRDKTMYTDSLLDGNTEYVYRIYVRTALVLLAQAEEDTASDQVPSALGFGG